MVIAQLFGWSEHMKQSGRIRVCQSRRKDHVEDAMMMEDITHGRTHELINSRGPVAILWDMENCSIPWNANVEDVAGNIRMALRFEAKGAVTLFSAYGDFNRFSGRVREGCQKTGINLIDVPNRRKDAADKAILVDMFLFAVDNPPPCTILLISGDVDFSAALHKLGQRGYTIALAVPTISGVSPALYNAGQYVWDWKSVACGYPARLVLESVPKTGISCKSIQSGIPRTTNYQIDEQGGNMEGMVAQPGDIERLKLQLIELIFCSHGGNLPIVLLETEYLKSFGKHLHFAEYGSRKRAQVLKKMQDVLYVKGKGILQTLHLTEAGAKTASKYANLYQAHLCDKDDNDNTEKNYRQWNGNSLTCKGIAEKSWDSHNIIYKEMNSSDNEQKFEVIDSKILCIEGGGNRTMVLDEDVHPFKKRKSVGKNAVPSCISEVAILASNTLGDSFAEKIMIEEKRDNLMHAEEQDGGVSVSNGQNSSLDCPTNNMTALDADPIVAAWLSNQMGAKE